MNDARPASSPRRDYAPPPVDSDFYKITDVLASEERPILARVRAFMEAEVAPIINDYWSKGRQTFGQGMRWPPGQRSATHNCLAGRFGRIEPLAVRLDP